MSIVWAKATRCNDAKNIRLAFPDLCSSRHQILRQHDIVRWRPGTIVELDASPQAPDVLCDAAAAVALALIDQDTPVWLSATADCRAVRKYLRSHTACAQVTESTLADFAIVARLGELPCFGNFFCGTRAYPQRSTTLIVQVDGLASDGPWRLSGPGIPSERRLGAKGLGEVFLSQWAQNTGLFPRGIDVYLVCGRRLCVLPRTTRIDR